MKDLQNLMRQAQGMQQKLAQAQAEVAEASFAASAGGGLVSVTLKGDGEMTALSIQPDVFADGDAETLADLILAAHKEARAKVEAAGRAAMEKAMGPLAGLAGMKGLPF